jgi:hypothetical protein
MVAAVIVAGLLLWTGTTLIVDARLRRPRRPDLAERLGPFQPGSLADKARQWLDKQT